MRSFPLLLLLVLFGCAHRGAEGGPPVVGEIEVEGNTLLSDGEIVSRLVLSESGVRPIGSAFEFREELLRSDAKRIERLYAAHGHFEAAVVDVRTREQGGRIDIVFVLNEGRATKVTALEVEGLDGLSEKKEILEELELRRDRVFSEEEYDRSKALIAERLRTLGYAEAEVGGRIEVDKAQASARVFIEVSPGLQFRIARVLVFGAQNVSRSRVAEATELEEGGLLTPKALAQAQARLYGLGVFSLVRVKAGAFNRANATVPVVVEVTEAPFMGVEASGGVEFDPGRSMLGVRAAWTHRNLARGLQKLRVTGAAGYAWVPGVFSYVSGTGNRRGIVGGLGVEFTQPRVARSPFDLVLGADYEKDVTQAFGFQRLGARVSAPFKPDGFRALTIAPGASFSYYFAINADELSGSDTLSTAGCGPAEQGRPTPESCRLLSADLLVNLDLRDDPIDTRRGFFASLNIARAFSPISDFKYWRFTPDLRGYLPVSDSLTFGLRMRYGLLHDIGEGTDRRPPGVARFFAGGANSVRGVGSQQLGPRKFVVIDNPDAKKSGQPPYLANAPVPLGGDRLLEGSLELRWLTPAKAWSIAMFLDAGVLSIGEESFFPSVSEGLIAAVGVGARWRSPVGPIRLDLGRRIDGFSQVPDELDVRVKDKTAYESQTGAGSATDPARYTISTRCEGTGPKWLCYEEGFWRGFQIWITVGEAF